MDSRAFYLKYRPQKISELGLFDIREGLAKFLKSGRVSHALLFVGPRGTGKTSAARIVAKAINCQKREKREKETRKTQKIFEPCNRCLMCQEITEGSALDLIEIDAASNRGIDDIRNLREKIKLAPAKAKYKVYIIDEVHMLTKEAFNALLKTLEEPPAHAVFILCTTEPEKLPPTIVSRCLRFNFKKATTKEIVEGPLKQAVKGEGLKVEKGVLEEIAKAVDGSFRDAHKILEQLSFNGKKISLKETKNLLGQIEALAPERLLNLLAEKEAKLSLLEIDRIVKIGGNLAVYVQEILDQLRLAMLAKVGLEEITLAAVVEKLSLAEIKILIELFSRAVKEMKTNPIPQLPLELVVVEWCSGVEGEIRSPLFSEPRDEVKGKVKTNVLSLTDSPIQQSDYKSNLSQTANQNSSKRATPSSHSRNNENGLEEIEKRWGELLAQIRPLNHSVEALLRAARPAKIEGEFLTLEVFYPFHKERLETEKCRAVVEEVASQILGCPVKLRCVLGEKKATQFPQESSSKKPEVGELSSDEDIVQAAEEIFGIDAN